MARSTKRVEVIRVYNRSKQSIPLQVRPPHGDFYLHEQQVYIVPGKSVMLPKDHVLMAQIANLQGRGMLKVTFDSETQAG